MEGLTFVYNDNFTGVMSGEEGPCILSWHLPGQIPTLYILDFSMLLVHLS